MGHWRVSLKYMLPCLSLSLLPDTMKWAALSCHLLCQPQKQQSYMTSDWSCSNLEPIRLHSVVYVKNSIQAAKVWLTHTGSPFWRCWENRGHIDDWNCRIWDLNTLLSFNMVHFPTYLDPKPTGLTTGLRTEISLMTWTFKSQSDWKWVEENVHTPAH